MNLVITWSAILGVLFMTLIIGLRVIAAAHPEVFGAVDPNISDLMTYGRAVGEVISPALQLALILAVVAGLAAKLDFRLSALGDGLSFGRLSQATNIQAVIALIIVFGVTIAALGNAARVDVLKDLALVVVGFYFGTRRREGELEAVAVGTAAGIASGTNPQVGDRTRHQADLQRGCATRCATATAILGLGHRSPLDRAR